MFPSKNCRDTALFGRSKLSEIANVKNYNVNANSTSFSFNHLQTPSAIVFVRCLKDALYQLYDNTLQYTDWDLHTLACVMQTLQLPVAEV